MTTVILAKKVSAPPGNAMGRHISAAEYLQRIGVPEIPPCTAPFDPGYDSATIEGHLDQSAGLIEILKISMSCWVIADEDVTRRKVAAAAVHSVPTVTTSGLFQIAAARGQIESYLDLCAEFGIARVECDETVIADNRVRPSVLVKMAHSRGLEVQFELGAQAGNSETTDRLIELGDRWLNAGAAQLAVEVRDMAQGPVVADTRGNFNPLYADRLARAFGLEAVTFSAPDPTTQFCILDHFGREAHLCNVRLEDLLNVESMRRGLHAAALSSEHLRLNYTQPDITFEDSES